MYNITNADDLQKAIILLENEMDEQKQLLTDHLRLIYESFTPVNVIKDVFKEVVTSEEFRSNIITAMIGISTGYIAKKLLFRGSNNPLKFLFGNLFQYGVANLLMHPARILRTIMFPLQELFTNKHERK